MQGNASSPAISPQGPLSPAKEIYLQLPDYLAQ